MIPDVFFLQEEILLETNRNLRRKVKTYLIYVFYFMAGNCMFKISIYTNFSWQLLGLNPNLYHILEFPNLTLITSEFCCSAFPVGGKHSINGSNMGNWGSMYHIQQPTSSVRRIFWAFTTKFSADWVINLIISCWQLI